MALADDMDLQHATVRQWFYRDSIPSRYWRALIMQARTCRKVTLTMTDLDSATVVYKKRAKRAQRRRSGSTPTPPGRKPKANGGAHASARTR